MTRREWLAKTYVDDHTRFFDRAPTPEEAYNSAFKAALVHAGELCKFALSDEMGPGMARMIVAIGTAEVNEEGKLTHVQS